MDYQSATAILARVRHEREKTAEGSFESAVHQMQNQAVKSEALRDVGNLALLSAGLGASWRGASGLYNLLTRRHKKLNTRSGPTELPLPYPAEPKYASWLGDAFNFARGDSATTKGGIPAYYPAMLLGGMGGLAAGWKGIDALLDARRKSEREHKLESARQEFHDALLSQYDNPIDSPHLSNHRRLKAAQTDTMVKIGQELDRLYDQFEKTGVTAADVGGGALGLYGLYAGLSGLTAGSLLYDRTKKRSQNSIIRKALQRRERNRFLAQPPEIYARPEPIPVSTADED